MASGKHHSRGGHHARRKHRSKKERTEEPAQDRRHRESSHRSSRHRIEPPAVSSHFRCHICLRHHWTVECPKLSRHPEQYPLLDRRKGCWQCGQRGHGAAQCTNLKHRCKECGGLHDTKECIYDHVGEEWCEFVDPVTAHVFYTNADESTVQWLPPSHELDTVLWYCPACRVLNPSQTDACLRCQATRPSALLPADGLGASSSDSSDSSSSSSGSDSDSESDNEEEERGVEDSNAALNGSKE